MLMFVSDNASNNDTLATSLEHKLKGEGMFKGRRHRVRCFADILNLVMQVCIFVFILLRYLRFSRHFCVFFSKQRKGPTFPEATRSGRSLPTRSASTPLWQAKTWMTIQIASADGIAGGGGDNDNNEPEDRKPVDTNLDEEQQDADELLVDECELLAMQEELDEKDLELEPILIAKHREMCLTFKGA